MGGSRSALTLLVTRVGTDHAHTAVAADDLALLADLFNAGSYFHDGSSQAANAERSWVRGITGDAYRYL